MHIQRFLTAGLLGAAAFGLSGCTDGYGYSGVGVGIGSGYGYGHDGYGYAGGYGDPYWGWYGDYYYPGTGYYVYDRYRRPLRWNDAQRTHWTQRRHAWRGDAHGVRDNWREFGGHRATRWGGFNRGVGAGGHVAIPRHSGGVRHSGGGHSGGPQHSGGRRH